MSDFYLCTDIKQSHDVLAVKLGVKFYNEQQHYNSSNSTSSGAS